MRAFSWVLFVHRCAFPCVESTCIIMGLAQVAHNFLIIPILLKVLDPCRRQLTLLQ